MKVVAVKPRAVTSSVVQNSIQRNVSVRQSPQYGVALAAMRGAKGESGKQIPAIKFRYSDVSSRVIHTLESDSCFIRATIVISEAFDGEGAAIWLRTSDGRPVINSLSPDRVCVFDLSKEIIIEEGGAIELCIASGSGATKGFGSIILEIN